MRHMRRTNNLRGSSPAVSGRGGFTLVEMLVSVGLVLLMMLMFAEIFTIASGSISLQRGIAQDDQKVRSVSTVLRGDLDKRTFRRLSPFLQGETDATVSSDRHFNQRRGYFYISENDPNNDTDDVLQFTVDANIVTTDDKEDTTRYFGRATLLTNPAVPSLFFRNANQPVADDGQIDPNDSTSSSSMAEVSYFLRNGNLYRRVLLIREPLDIAGADAQPRTGAYGPYDANVDFFDPSPGGSNPPPVYPQSWQTGNFWGDFDFSAYRRASSGWAHFHGAITLDNGAPTAAGLELANPRRRFGHNHADDNGLPREFLSSNGSSGFFGRFTHEETSHPNFRYPQFLSSTDSDYFSPGSATLINDGNPMKASGITTNALTDSNGDGIIDQYAGGNRRAQDLLLANVISFDIEVWDARLGGFVDIGHSLVNGLGQPGQFNALRNRNPGYGPSPAAPANNRVFDTWHPNMTGSNQVGSVNGLTNQHEAAYQPKLVPWPQVTGDPDRTWQPNTTYAVGDMVLPTFIDAGNHSHPENLFGARAYLCVVGGDSGPDPADEPQWDIFGRVPGNRVSEPNGTAQWETVDNLAPLRAIRITLQFRDPSTARIRQTTIVHGLLD